MELFNINDLGAAVFLSSFASSSLSLSDCYFVNYSILFSNLFRSSIFFYSYYRRNSSSSGSSLTYFFLTISAELFWMLATDLERRLYQLTTIDLTWLNGFSSIGISLFLTTYNYFSYVIFFIGLNDFFNNSGWLNLRYVYSK